MPHKNKVGRPAKKMPKKPSPANPSSTTSPGEPGQSQISAVNQPAPQKQIDPGASVQADLSSTGAKSEILESELQKALAPAGGEIQSPAPADQLPIKRPELDQEDIEAFTDGLKGLFDLMAAWAGPHWSLKEMESKSLGKRVAKVFYKHVPDFKNSDEMFLALSVAGIMIPRARISIELKKEKAAAEEKQITHESIADENAKS